MRISDWSSDVCSSDLKWSQRYRATGSVAPGKMGGYRKRVLEPHRAFIVERIEQIPHLTLHRLKNELAARGVVVSHNAVWQFLRRAHGRATCRERGGQYVSFPGVAAPLKNKNKLQR